MIITIIIVIIIKVLITVIILKIITTSIIFWVFVKNVVNQSEGLTSYLG